MSSNNEVPSLRPVGKYPKRSRHWTRSATGLFRRYVTTLMMLLPVGCGSEDFNRIMLGARCPVLVVTIHEQT